MKISYNFRNISVQWLLSFYFCGGGKNVAEEAYINFLHRKKYRRTDVMRICSNAF